MKKVSMQALILLQIIVLAGFVLVAVNAMPLKVQLTEEIAMPRFIKGDAYTVNVKSPSCNTHSPINDIYLKKAMSNIAMAFAAQQGKDVKINYEFIAAGKAFAYYRITAVNSTAMNVAVSIADKNSPKIVAWEDS